MKKILGIVAVFLIVSQPAFAQRGGGGGGRGGGGGFGHPSGGGPALWGGFFSARRPSAATHSAVALFLSAGLLRSAWVDLDPRWAVSPTCPVIRALRTCTTPAPG